VVGVCAIALTLEGQSALTTREVTGAKTCLGNVEVRAASIEPSPNIVIALMAETLSADELAQFQKEVGSFYQTLNSKPTLRLALISGGAVQFAGPFQNRAQLQAGLAGIAHPAPENAQTANAIQFHSDLAGVLPQLGGGWSTVVLAGRFPAMDRELAPYAAAWLSERLQAAKLQTSYWTPGDPSEVLDAALPPTGGGRLSGGLAPFVKSSARWEVSWQEPAPPAGWRVCPIDLIDDDVQTVAIVPTIAAAPGAAIPDIGHYALWRERVTAMAKLVKQPQLAAEQMAQAVADLGAALEISPRDEETLHFGAELYRRSQDDSKLAAMLRGLAELAPKDPAVFAELGHCLFRMRDWDGADRALLKARELKPDDPSVAEELARIRLSRGDDRGFLAFVKERLSSGAGTQELWLLSADAANRLGDWQSSADFTEHAIVLGGIPLERRTALVRLYMQHQAASRALVHVRAMAASLPPDVTVRMEYARFLEDLKQPEEALAAWKRSLEADPKCEPAHYRITQLLIEKNAHADALDAAEAGIQAAPRSARLYLAKAGILEEQDRFYQARQTLRDAAPTVQDSSLVARLAEMEDAGGEHAARYYRALAEAGDNGVLQRGLQAARRDADFENIAWFQTKSGTAPGVAAARAQTGNVTIPGGLAPLAFIAHSRSSSPERFLVEYARAIVPFLELSDRKVGDLFTQAIRDHFRRIGELAAFGKAADGRVTVTISANDKNGQKNAEKVLDLLGWKMHTSKQGVKLDPAEKGAKATHQETATALAVDEIGMQQALEAGKPFSFSIPMEGASVVLGEELWKTQFYPKENVPGGLAEVMSGNLEFARTYAALGQMDPGTAAVLVSGLGLKTLAEKYASLLFQYSSSMAVERGRAAVPGGEHAEAIWAKLAGANPAQPGPFFKALLSKDEGKLLAYYSALGELDIGHQRFFTRTPDRTARFYDLFKESPEIQRSTARHLKSGSFVEFLSEVPLDGDGNVDFPGSPEVWMVAKGQSRSSEHTTKMMKKLKRAVAPDLEDEILLRLARTRYKDSNLSRSELDNFVAVVRIDEHRSNPLDESSALLLAQHFAEDGAAYPYFAILTGLGQKHFEQFFALEETLRPLPQVERAALLAPIDSLIEIVCLAQQAGTLDETQAAELFGKIVERFQKVSSPAARTAASLDLVREILARGKNAADDPDAAMQVLLLGPAETSSTSGDATPSVPTRVRGYRQVLELQKVPALATVLALADAVQSLRSGKGNTAAAIQVLESRAAGLFAVDVPKELGLIGKERELVEAFQPRRLPEIVKQFREKTAKKNVKLQDLDKLAREYLEAIEVPTRWALAGIVYAYFLRPDDLLASEDPLLLRKHQFVTLNSVGSSPVFEAAELVESSQKAGSNFVGGFASFADAAGHAAAVSAKLGGVNGQLMASKQISAIRSTNWGKLRDEDLRLFGLKEAVAREWVVRAAGEPDLAQSLGEAAFGLLSLTRRAELLGAVADGHWRAVWNVLTLSDLYFLADRYLAHYPTDPWTSPATQALRSEMKRNDGSRLTMLGGELLAISGCSHPHLRGTMPYEEYERDPFKVAERSAEFKLYLVRYADTAGLSASALGGVAENAARAILKQLQLSDIYDWRSVLASYAGFDGKGWEEASIAR
jgi:Flp pilus assembly protein TadD